MPAVAARHLMQIEFSKNARIATAPERLVRRRVFDDQEPQRVRTGTQTWGTLIGSVFGVSCFVFRVSVWGLGFGVWCLGFGVWGLAVGAGRLRTTNEG